MDTSMCPYRGNQFLSFVVHNTVEQMRMLKMVSQEGSGSSLPALGSFYGEGGAFLWAAPEETMGPERRGRIREDRFVFNRRKKCLIIMAKQNQKGLRAHWGHCRDTVQTVRKNLSTVEGQVEYHMGCWSRWTPSLFISLRFYPCIIYLHICRHILYILKSIYIWI